MVNSPGPGFRIKSSKLCKIFLENIAHDNVYYLAEFLYQMVSDSKDIYLKMYSISCAKINNEVKIFKVDKMV